MRMTRPRAIWSATTICSARRTGSCIGNNSAEIEMETFVVAAAIADASVTGADMYPSGVP